MPGSDREDEERRPSEALSAPPTDRTSRAEVPDEDGPDEPTAVAPSTPGSTAAESTAAESAAAESTAAESTAAESAAAESTAAESTAANDAPTIPPPPRVGSPDDGDDAHDGPAPPLDGAPPSLELPPTLIAALDGEQDVPGEPTRSIVSPAAVDEDDEVVAPADRGLARPPLEITHSMRELPPPRRAPGAPAARERALAWAARVVVGASMALGIAVVVAHVARAGATPEAGPLRVVVGAESAPAAAGHTPRITTAGIDRRASLEQLQRQAADHLAAGRLADASGVYAVLAERAPHERAYAIAARVLAEKAAR